MAIAFPLIGYPVSRISWENLRNEEHIPEAGILFLFTGTNKFDIRSFCGWVGSSRKMIVLPLGFNLKFGSADEMGISGDEFEYSAQVAGPHTFCLFNNAFTGSRSVAPLETRRLLNASGFP